MVSFTATYTSATGQPRTVTVKANDAVSARRLLRRRGIKAEELRQDTGKGKENPRPSPKTQGEARQLDGCRWIWEKRSRSHPG